MLDFNNKICFVSGAGGQNGIGFAIAKLLGKLGEVVVITDVVNRVFERAEELKIYGIACEAFQCDLTNCTAVKKMIDTVLEKYGRIDVLVNNAGWNVEGEVEEYPEFTETEDDDWNLKFSRNLVTNYNVTKAVLPAMRKNGYGRIVNTASVIGPLLGAEGDSAYAAGKGAIDRNEPLYCIRSREGEHYCKQYSTRFYIIGGTREQRICSRTYDSSR